MKPSTLINVVCVQIGNDRRLSSLMNNDNSKTETDDFHLYQKPMKHSNVLFSTGCPLPQHYSHTNTHTHHIHIQLAIAKLLNEYNFCINNYNNNKNEVQHETNWCWLKINIIQYSGAVRLRAFSASIFHYILAKKKRIKTKNTKLNDWWSYSIRCLSC